MTRSRFWKNLHPLIRRDRKSPYEDDTNYAILNAIDNELKDLEEETFKSRIQSSLKTATGFFLDEYGDFFGVFRRKEDEEDEDYRERIVEAINVPRGTNDSIKKAIRSYLENNTLGIEIYEPWEDIFYLNRPPSRLNGKHKMQGKYYHFAVIDVYIGSPFGKDIVSLINDYKPAGVTLHTTYDPSLGDIDISGENYWGAIPYIHTLTKPIETTLEMYNSLYQPLSGRVKLSDSKLLNTIFNLNNSDINSEDVLSGNYSTSNSRLHIAGTAREFNPSNDSLMKDSMQNFELAEPEFYIGRDNLNKNQYKVKLRPTKQFCVTLNIDTLFGTNHPELDRFTGDYEEVIKNSSLQISVKAKLGNLIRLQYFDFNRDRWETLDSFIAQNSMGEFKVRLKDGNKYLNSNQLMYLRISVPKDMEITINHFHMDYVGGDSNTEMGYQFKVEPPHTLILKGLGEGEKIKSFPEDEPYPYIVEGGI